MVSREIDNRIPIAAKLMMSDEPPALRNGRVMPVIGTRVTTTAMLMNAWMHSQPVMPAASNAPNVSGAASATRAPEYARPANRAITMTAPMSPNSWPTSAKMKSLKAFGTDTMLWPRPRPAIPPDPRASSPWTVWKPAPEWIRPRVEPGPDPIHLVALQPEDDGCHEGAATNRAERCARLAPATKNNIRAGQAR